MQSSQLRSAVNRLAIQGDRDLAALFKQVSTAAQARTALFDVMPALVEQYGSASAVLAAEWYDQARAKAGVRGRFQAAPADLGRAGAEALVGFGTRSLDAAEPDFTLARTVLAGGLQRRIANYARATVTTSSVRDPQAKGWQRVGDGNSCEFCSMLLTRGAVYTEATSDFPAHDHCGCSAEPAFR